MMTPDPNAKWDPNPTQDWFDEVEKWNWNQVGDSWVKSGDCPRCGHHMSKELLITYIMTLAGKSEKVESPAEVEISCNCRSPHDKCPANEQGCGQAAINFTGPPKDDPSKFVPTPGRLPIPPTTIYTKWQAKADDLKLTELDRVRATAGLWTATIGSLTGIFGIAALVKWPADASQLTMEFRQNVLIVLLGAGAFLFLSILTAALAAQGVPKQLFADGPTLREATAAAATRAVDWLGASRLLAILAVAAILVAIYQTSSGPKAPVPVTVVVVEKSGVTLCGTLATEPDGSTSLLASGSITTPLTNVTSLTLVSACH